MKRNRIVEEEKIEHIKSIVNRFEKEIDKMQSKIQKQEIKTANFSQEIKNQKKMQFDLINLKELIKAFNKNNIREIETLKSQLNIMNIKLWVFIALSVLFGIWLLL